jgi:hypothetical protein
VQQASTNNRRTSSKEVGVVKKPARTRYENSTDLNARKAGSTNVTIESTNVIRESININPDSFF